MLKWLEYGGVASPAGYRAAGVCCGIKKDQKDMAVVVSDMPAAAAGVYTRNVVKGHSLQLTMERMAGKKAGAVMINSGCANACVGDAGYKDAALLTSHLASLLSRPAESVMIGSTGVIGQRLPMEKLLQGIQQIVPMLNSGGGSDAAEAIMTTDTVKKECAVQYERNGRRITIGGMAKGSGMIHPNMGTMISIITSDIAITPELLQEVLQEVTNRTFNRVSVDGDTSVCDMCLLFANTMAGNTLITEKDQDYAAFAEGLDAVCTYLARQLAKDGEGATKLLEIIVKNAKTCADAYTIACSIAKSPLCKTAFFGEDANWGRIITAAGYSGVPFDPNTVDIYLGPLMTCRDGTALAFDEEAALQILKKNEVTVTVDLKAGFCMERMWTCDFSYDYIKINGSYRS